VAERHLYLVRHGQLDLRAFAENHLTAGLTPLGREQARFTARRLRALDVRAIYCSTLGRAKETAEIISREFPKIVLRPSNPSVDTQNRQLIDTSKPAIN